MRSATSRSTLRYIVGCCTLVAVSASTSHARWCLPDEPFFDDEPAIALEMATVTGAPGETVEVPVIAELLGDPGSRLLLSSTCSEIEFSPATQPVTNGSLQPACETYEAGDFSHAATLLPEGCTPGRDCRALEMYVLSYRLDLLQDGEAAFTCRFRIPHGTPLGFYPLLNTPVFTADGDGRRFPAIGSDGGIFVTSTCAGDCDLDGHVSVSELQRLVRVAVRSASFDSCRAGDRNGDGRVAVNEIYLALGDALGDCQ